MIIVPANQEERARTPQELIVAQVRSPDFQSQVALALPENMPAHRFVRATVTALMQNEDLAKAEPRSVFNAAIKCAQDGLLPDGREAALVVYNVKQGDSWVKRAQYLPMIAGFRKIAAEHGWSLRTQVVYANDEFDHQLGLEERLVHKPVRPGAERGEMIAAYAVATHRDGRRELEVMYRADIEKARAVSRAKDRGPWVDWEERMWEKTVGKRLFAKLPLDPADKRVAGLLADTSQDPAAAIYGNSPARQVEAPSSPQRQLPPVAGEIVDGRVAGVDESQQAPADAPLSAGVPGDDQEPQVGEPQAEQEPVDAEAFPIPDGVQEQLAPPSPEEIQAAMAAVIPKGSMEGQTLGHVISTVGGTEWLQWSLDRAPSYWSKSFRRQLELVAAQVEAGS